MKSIEDLRNHLATIFEDLKAGQTKASEAKELANVAGKIIGTTKVQLAYCALRKEKPLMPFLACSGK